MIVVLKLSDQILAPLDICIGKSIYAYVISASPALTELVFCLYENTYLRQAGTIQLFLCSHIFKITIDLSKKLTKDDMHLRQAYCTF